MRILADSSVCPGERFSFSAFARAVSFDATSGNRPPQGSTPDDGNSDGSFTGSPSTLFGPAFVSGSIASTVSFGADGAHADGGFGFATGATASLDLIGLTSKGGAVHYAILGDTLVGFVDVGPQNHSYNPLFDRTIFTLTLDPSTGDFQFRQFDQLDHVDGSGKNFDLKTATGTLHGTLLIPDSTKPKPVVLLIAGSGPTDRNGNSAALPGKNNSLLMLAEGLAARGIASLRFDKRGIAESRTAGFQGKPGGACFPA